MIAKLTVLHIIAARMKSMLIVTISGVVILLMLFALRDKTTSAADKPISVGPIAEPASRVNRPVAKKLNRAESPPPRIQPETQPQQFAQTISSNATELQQLYRKGAEKAVSIQYGEAIKALSLRSETDENSLRRILVERQLILFDAFDVVKQSYTAWGQAELKAASAAQLAAIQQEIGEKFGADVERQVQEMLRVSDTMIKLNTSYKTVFQNHDALLEPGQLVPLATLLEEAYIPSRYQTSLIAASSDQIPQLSPLDLRLLERASSILKPKQVSALREALARDLGRIPRPIN